MLEDLEADEKARKYLGIRRSSIALVDSDLQSPAVLMTEKLRKEEDERLEEEKVLLKAELRASKEAIQQHKKVVCLNPLQSPLGAQRHLNIARE